MIEGYLNKNNVEEAELDQALIDQFHDLERNQSIFAQMKESNGAIKPLSSSEIENIEKSYFQYITSFVRKYYSNCFISQKDFISFFTALVVDFCMRNNIELKDKPSVEALALGKTYGVFYYLNNSVIVNSNFYLEFLRERPSSRILTLFNLIGHEMTHFMQQEKIDAELKEKGIVKTLDAMQRCSNKEIFDDFSCRTIKYLMNKKDRKHIDRINECDLKIIANFDNYYMDMLEVEARVGGMKFETELIQELCKKHQLPKETIKTLTKQWKYSVLNDKEDLKYYSVEYDRVVKRYKSVFPELEELFFDMPETELQGEIMNRVNKSIKEKDENELIACYWTAVKNGNELIVPLLCEQLKKVLNNEQKKEIIEKTFKIISRKSALSMSANIDAHVPLLIGWGEFNNDSIVYYLMMALEMTNKDALVSLFNSSIPAMKKREILQIFLPLYVRQVHAMIKRMLAQIKKDSKDKTRLLRAIKMSFDEKKILQLQEFSQELLPIIQTFMLESEQVEEISNMIKSLLYSIKNENEAGENGANPCNGA